MYTCYKFFELTKPNQTRWIMVETEKIHLILAITWIWTYFPNTQANSDRSTFMAVRSRQSAYCFRTWQSFIRSLALEWKRASIEKRIKIHFIQFEWTEFYCFPFSVVVAVVSFQFRLYIKSIVPCTMLAIHCTPCIHREHYTQNMAIIIKIICWCMRSCWLIWIRTHSP